MADLVMIALQRNLEIAQSLGDSDRAKRIQSRIEAREAGEVEAVPAEVKPKARKRSKAASKASSPARTAPKRARKPAKTAQKEAPAAEKETPAEDIPLTVEKEEAED